MTTYNGACFCGSVTLTVTGEAVAQGYCHCNSCRSWSASPVNAFALWKPESVTVTQGAELIGTYNKTPISFRKFCTKCGGHLMTDHPTFGLVDVFAATIPSFPHTPHLHVYYSEKVLRIADGLPKFADFPEAFGGSGTTMED